MRAWLLFFALAVCSLTVQSAAPMPARAAGPQRVVSLNLCTDQLLVLLLPAERIAGLSILARQRENSFVAEQAKNFPIIRDDAERIITLAPDLVLTGRYNSRLTRRLLRGQGIAVHVETIPTSLAGVRRQIHRLAKRLGVPARGAALAAEIRQAIEQTSAGSGGNPDRSPRRLAAIFQPNGHTLGLNTLENEILQVAGFQNLAAKLGIRGNGSLSLEQIVVHRPQVIIFSRFGDGTDSLAEAMLRHPSLNSLTDSRQVHLPASYWSCGGPMITKAIELLRALP